MKEDFQKMEFDISYSPTEPYFRTSICTIWKILFWHIVWTVHVLFTLPLQSLKIIFVKNTLVLLAVVAKGVDWGRVGLKKSTPYHNFRAICILYNSTSEKKSLPEFKILTKTLLLVHLFEHVHIAHTTYSWNIKWKKCASMGLNGFIFKKINEN